MHPLFNLRFSVTECVQMRETLKKWQNDLKLLIYGEDLRITRTQLGCQIPNCETFIVWVLDGTLIPDEIPNALVSGAY